MEIIQKYRSKDKQIFNTAEECVKYEILLDKVNDVLSKLPTVKENSNFINGGGYIQHTQKDIDFLNKSIVDLANEYFEPSDKFQHFNYYLGRVIDDSNTLCLNNLSYKLRCIDVDNKEWGQPYFAINVGKGKI